MAEFSDQLLITVGGNIVSAVIMAAGGLFVLAQNWRKDLNRLFFFLSVSTFIYTICFVVASLQTDYDSAYFWWFLNIFDVFIPMAIVHFVLRVANKHTQLKWFIRFVYVSGLVIFAAAWILPSAFLPQVEPKLYFPYYLDGGWLYWVMLAHFLFPPFIAFIYLLIAFKESAGIERKRLEYIVLMLLVGYAIGPLNFFLVFDIPLDPLYGMFVGFYFLPIAYGIFATDLLDIRIVVRRAFFTAVGIGAIAAFLSALIFLNDFLANAIPGMQSWTVPFGVAVVAFIVGRSVLMQSRETERLKYEFITVATHKLRTPLTHIHWLVPELLDKVGENTDLREGIRRIDSANNRLIELTNILLEAAQESGITGYKKEPVDLAAPAKESLDRFKTQITEKKLVVTFTADGAPKALGDARRLASVIDVLIENAVVYTPEKGSIAITIAKDKHGVRFSIKDTGIGIATEDQRRIFSSFFRTSAAKTADTEGVGLGLSLSKDFIAKQGGSMGVDSDGEGKGSTFWFFIPAA